MTGREVIFSRPLRGNRHLMVMCLYRHRGEIIKPANLSAEANVTLQRATRFLAQLRLPRVGNGYQVPLTYRELDYYLTAGSTRKW